MRNQSIARSSDERNTALLIKALAAGCLAVPVGFVIKVRSKREATHWYTVRRNQTREDARTETCDCDAMNLGKRHMACMVVRWRTADGAARDNGVRPCSHILVARFDARWRVADDDARRVWVDRVPGLEAAIAANGYYSLEA